MNNGRKIFAFVLVVFVIGTGWLVFFMWEDNQDDYVIDNTGTLVGLFYKVLKFVTDYMV